MSERTRVDGWIDELTARIPLADRERTEWDEVLRAVVERLIDVESWPGVEGSPWLLLDEIAHRTLAPGAGERRAALENALRERFAKAGGVNERVFLLRQLALVGDDATVPFLESLREDEDVAVREYALRAREAIPAGGSRG
jgi:hypothetical protein